jgi:hypothetical protein
MITKIASLEGQLAAVPSQEVNELRIAELEFLLDEQTQKLVNRSLLTWVMDIVRYLIVPLLLLLLAHWLITVVYDTKMVYLRLISMILPLPFAYFLFKGHAHKLFPWFVGVVFLAISSVIGMSWITSLVDRSPVWPQNFFEWKEVLEYSASIAFSFLTGMLLGGVAYASKQRYRRKARISPFMKAVAAGIGEGRMSPSNIYTIMKTLQDYGATVIALGTTGLSLYTGLKGIVGS